MSGLEVAMVSSVSLSRSIGTLNLGPRVKAPPIASPVRAGFGVLTLGPLQVEGSQA